jgi:hypothetical protein
VGGGTGGGVVEEGAGVGVIVGEEGPLERGGGTLGWRRSEPLLVDVRSICKFSVSSASAAAKFK